MHLRPQIASEEFPTDDFESSMLRKARFKHHATAMPNSIDRIKFDFNTAVAQRLKPSRATDVPNSISQITNALEYI